MTITRHTHGDKPPRQPGRNNVKRINDSLAKRETIARVWLQLRCGNAYETITPKVIAPKLPFKIGLSALAWHMKQIREATPTTSIDPYAFEWKNDLD